MTLCAHNRECIFGVVWDGEMVLKEYGKWVEYTWHDLPNHNSDIALDTFIIMPNHIHGIIIIHDATVGAGSEPAPTTKPRGLFEIVRQFKTFSSKRINEIRRTHGTPVWQRNYYEHIVRGEAELNKIREYIASNPSQWGKDKENPENTAPFQPSFSPASAL